MWGKAPFTVADGYGLDVKSLDSARTWYKDKLGFRDASAVEEDDSGRPSCRLVLSDKGTTLSLVEKDPAETTKQDHVIFYTSNLQGAREWIMSRGVPVGTIESDSGGNRFFKILDFDGNVIEVCVEPE